MAAGLMALSCPAWAEWKVQQEIETGYQAVDLNAPEAKFQEYKEYPSGAVIPSYTLEAQDERTRVTFDAANVKQEDQSYSLEINRDSRWKIGAGWDQTPHRYSETSTTLYNEVSPNVWRLPDNIQGVLQGASNSVFITSYTQLSTASRDMDLGIRNDKGRLELGYRASDKLRFDLGFTDEKIKGKKPVGASFGRSYAIQLPDTIDYEIRTMNAGSQFNTKAMQFGVDYSMQAFENELESLIWDNAKRTSVATTGTERTVEGRAARPPDNVAHYGTARAGFDLPVKTRFTADMTFGYLESNEDLLPYSINPSARNGATPGQQLGFDASVSSSLPVSKSGGRALTFNQAYRMTNRIIKPLTIGAGFRSYQYNDKTPETAFAGRTFFDQYVTTGTIAPKRFSTRKDVIDASADVDILRSLSAGIKYSVEWNNREHREVRETKEHEGTASLDYRPLMSLLVRGSYTRAKRSGQDFEIEDYESNGSLIETPGLRRYDVADRDRDQGDIQVQWTPGPITLVLQGGMGFDRFGAGKGDLTGGTTYQAQTYGLLNNRFHRLGADLSWDANSWLSLDGYYLFEQNESNQRSNYNGGSAVTQDAETDWTNNQLDRYHIGGVSANMVVVPQKLNVRMGYELSRSIGALQFINMGSDATVSVVQTPQDTEALKQDISASTTLRLTPSVSLVLGYLFEKYDVYDWAHQNTPEVGGLAANQTNIYLADNSLDYKAHVGSLLVKYKF